MRNGRTWQALWLAVGAAGLAFIVFHVPGCVLDDWEPTCPTYDCSQCDVSLGDCLDAGFGLFEEDD